MERVQIHQGWLSHVARMVSSNEGLMADRAGEDGTRRSREAVPVVIAKEVAPRRRRSRHVPGRRRIARAI